MQERLKSDFNEMTLGDKDIQVKDSHTARLKHILDEPAIRSLFREFLRANFCEENLSFWLDTQDFKRRFNTTSSAVAEPAPGKGNRAIGHQAMERHQQDLIAMAFVIYNSEWRTFLVFSSRSNSSLSDQIAMILPPTPLCSNYRSSPYFPSISIALRNLANLTSEHH